MLPFILIACLMIHTALAIKLYLLNPHRKLNNYLSLLPALYTLTNILEINIYFTNNENYANKLYHIYQSLAFFPLISITLAFIEYVKIYTKKSAAPLLNAINIAVITINLIWTLLVAIYGPTAHIFLSGPSKWSINRFSMGPLFLAHTFSSIIWLCITVFICIYLMFNAESTKKKYWFGVLSFFQLLAVTGIILFIASHNTTAAPQFDLVTSIPITVIVFFQLWVLSNFTIFDVNPRNFYNELLAATNNWVIILDKKGTIKYINETAMKNSSFSYFQLIDNNIDSVMEINTTNNNFIAPSTCIFTAADTSFSEITVRFKKTDRLFNLQFSQQKLILPDKIEVVLWIMIDTTLISAMKAQKDIIEATSEELKHAYQDIAFVMNMTSHDLRAPLETLVELVGLVIKENGLPVPNRSGEYLGYIQSIGLQSLELSKQMVRYLKNGGTKKNKEWVKVDQLILQVKERLIMAIERSSVNITHEGIEQMYCDSEKIRELLANFIDNSIKYRSAEAPLIKITISETNMAYHFSIKDNGIGIDPDFIPKLFLAYARDEKNGAPGTGMGLFLCKKIIEASNGEISINNNRQEKGITVSFTISKFGMLNNKSRTV